MKDHDRFKSISQKKCHSCLRKDSAENRCALFSSRHAGIELCLGPFKDVEDQLKKFREDFKKERKQKADLDRAMREVILKTHLRIKKLFDDWLGKKNENPHDDY